MIFPLSVPAQSFLSGPTRSEVTPNPRVLVSGIRLASRGESGGVGKSGASLGIGHAGGDVEGVVRQRVQRLIGLEDDLVVLQPHAGGNELLIAGAEEVDALLVDGGGIEPDTREAQISAE